MADLLNSAGEFQRYSIDDRDALNRHILEFEGRIAEARGGRDRLAELNAASELGSLLTIARREAEAVALLESSLVGARAQPDKQLIGYLLLHLATAHQYLGRRDKAQHLFGEGLLCAETLGDQELKHFLLHHQGRCFVEQGELGRARDAFHAALALRLALSDPRAASTQRALDALGG